MRAGIEPAGQTLRKEVIAFARRLSRPLRSPSRDAPQASKPHRQDCLACLLQENPPVGLWHACSDRQNDAGVESSGGSAPAGEMKKPHRVDDRGSSARGDQSIYTWSTARAARGACSQGTDTGRKRPHHSAHSPSVGLSHEKLWGLLLCALSRLSRKKE